MNASDTPARVKWVTLLSFDKPLQKVMLRKLSNADIGIQQWEQQKQGSPAMTKVNELHYTLGRDRFYYQFFPRHGTQLSKEQQELLLSVATAHRARYYWTDVPESTSLDLHTWTRGV